MTDLSDEEAVRVAEVDEKMLSIKENSWLFFYSYTYIYYIIEYCA